MVRSYGMYVFNFIRSSQTVFQSGCTTSHGNVWEFQVLRVLLAILVSVYWGLTVVLICIFPSTNGVLNVFYGTLGHLKIFLTG